MLLFSQIFVNLSLSIKDITFNKVITHAYYFLVIFGFIMAASHEMNLLVAKNMIIFREPSHFALVLLPLSLYKLYFFESSKYILHLITLIVLALFLENMTLLVGVALIFIILNWGKKKKLFLTFIVLALVLSTIYLSFPYYFDLDYYMSRLQFTMYSNNVSVLVFISGWERAYLNLIDSYGFGIGLQRLGYIGELGIAMENIFRIQGIYLNLYDAGSTAPKIISEMGITGVILIIMYLYKFFQLATLISKKMIRKPSSLFFVSIYLLFSIQLFVRGVGYFSPMTYLLFASIYMLFIMNNFEEVKEVNV